MLFRVATIVMSSVPSWSVFTGIIGSSPLGMLLVPFYLRYWKMKYLLAILIVLVAIVINVRSIYSLFEGLLLFLPWLVLMYFARKLTYDNFTVRGLILVCFVFLIEAVIGNYFSSTSRSLTFITQEPSHSARAFYSIVYLLIFMRPNYSARLALLGIFYMTLNQSLTSLLMLVPLMFLYAKLGISVVLVIIFIASLGILPDRIQGHVVNLQSLTKKASLMDAHVIAVFASRRAAQSIGAFYLSSPVTGVGIGESAEYLVDSARGTWTDFGSLIQGNSNLGKGAKLGASSYLAQISYEFGYVYAIIFMLILLFVFTPSLSLFWLMLFITAVLQLLLFSSTLMPTPWILIGLSHAKRRNRS